MNYAIVITGGNKGLGHAVSKHIAHDHQTALIIGSRDEYANTKAVKTIVETTGNKNVFAFPLDLSDFDHIRAFAKVISYYVTSY